MPLEYDESSMTYSGNFAVSESIQGEYTQIAIDGAKTYAGFMSNDISMSSFLSRIIKGTQMYQDMSEYRQYWYTDHDSTAFETWKRMICGYTEKIASRVRSTLITGFTGSAASRIFSRSWKPIREFGM